MTKNIFENPFIIIAVFLLVFFILSQYVTFPTTGAIVEGTKFGEKIYFQYSLLTGTDPQKLRANVPDCATGKSTWFGKWVFKIVTPKGNTIQVGAWTSDPTLTSYGITCGQINQRATIGGNIANDGQGLYKPVIELIIMDNTGKIIKTTSYEGDGRSFTFGDPYPEKCSDGTLKNSCSLTKPKYCNYRAELEDNAVDCGCPSGFIQDPAKLLSCKAISDETTTTQIVLSQTELQTSCNYLGKTYENEQCIENEGKKCVNSVITSDATCAIQTSRFYNCNTLGEDYQAKQGITTPLSSADCEQIQEETDICPDLEGNQTDSSLCPIQKPFFEDPIILTLLGIILAIIVYVFLARK